MPIEKKDVIKAFFKSGKRKPVKEKKEVVKRKEFVKNEGRFFAPLKDSSKKVKVMEDYLKKTKKGTKLQRFFDNASISKSSPLDYRLGTYYEFENGVSMSIVTTEGTEMSSLTLRIDITEEDIRREKVPGLYHLTMQMLLSDKFIEVDWNPLEPGSFRDYIRDIRGKINLQYMPSCIMISVGCSSKDYIKMLEYFFDALYLRKKGEKRKFLLRKSSIKEAVVNMNMNYLEQIQDDTYLRFEILKEVLNRESNTLHKTTNKKSADLLNLWSFGSENTVHNLIREGNIEAEILTAHERIVEKKIVTVAFHSNLSHKRLFSILNDYDIPFLKADEVEEKKGIMNKIKFNIGSKGELIENKPNYKEVKKKYDNETGFKAPTTTILEFKPSIIVNTPLFSNVQTNGELEIQWIIPGFYSSLSSTKSKPLKILSHLFESGGLAEFLKKRRIVNSINSGEVYFAAHSSHKVGFTIFSLILKLSDNVLHELDPRSEIIQFTVQSIFVYIYSLIEKIDLSLKSENSDSESDELLFRVVKDIMQIENYISNSSYQMNSEKEDYIDFFDRNFVVTETIVQNIKSHNPSEILVGNNRLYSKINVILKYVKHTLEHALKPTNFILYLTSSTFFDRNKYSFSELKIKIQDIQPVKYLTIKFESVFIDLLGDKINLKKHVIKMDPLVSLVKKYNLVDEYEFLPTSHSLLKNSKLTFVDGNFEWSTFSSFKEPENPIEGTTPFISNPTLISDDFEKRLSIYYSQVMYPNMTEEVYQSSLSSGIIRWYDNFDYSKLLREKNVGINLLRNSFLASFISRILFAVWVTTTLASIFTSYKRIGATINFQPCHYHGTALPINCLQLYLTSPSPMFKEYITETLNSVRSISMVNITEEIALKIKQDTINELKQAIYSNSLSSNCTDKIKKILLSEFFTFEETLYEVNKLNNAEVSLLLNKKLFIQNPYITITGLLSHIDDPSTGIEIVKESLLLNNCFKNIENIISDMFYNDEYKMNTKIHSILDSLHNSSKKRLLFKLDTTSKVSKDEKEPDDKFQYTEEFIACSFWISVPKYDIKTKARIIMLSRIIQNTFNHVYLPTTLLVNKKSIKDINLVVVPSPFLGHFGIHFILEYINKDSFTDEDVSPSILLLDFLSFIKYSNPTNTKSSIDDIDSRNRRKLLLNSSLPIIYRQTKTEIILQLLLSQTQIVSQSSHLFGRITELLESGKTPTKEEIDEITHEKEKINEVIGNTDPNDIVAYFKTLLESSFMVIVESGTKTTASNTELYKNLLKTFNLEEVIN